MISYKMNLNCKNHAPFPAAMCNKCMPPSVIVKRQEYRHVDYAEFTNQAEIANFVQNWLAGGKILQRMGFLYGYYAEDPNYKNGVRAIIEAIYEPPQKSEVSSVELLPDPFQNQVDVLAQHLGFERIGWIFTTLDQDTVLSSHDLRQAARFQEEHISVHPSGYKVSKFITVTIRTRKDDTGDVVPDVYMLSDQGQALERDNILEDSDKRKMVKIRTPREGEILPTVIAQGKSSTYVEPEFFIVNVAHGAPKNNNYATIKHSDFPVENRKDPQRPSDVKTYLTKFSRQPSHVKYADFHLLLYIARIMDIHTACYLAECVRDETPVSEDFEAVIKSLQ
eukprot:TRINITY_DN4451_c0_g1_i3.p1 TRINITY_DN4451_c0_g1~~TRINITY_DN4451_c0_g1_i3.p1  ORF type:complete len:336 (-),score=77.01 TRINITY_DN4451_c0_g1_i3:127-1134(-)